MSLKKFIITGLCALFVSILSSCGSLGYSVMLWGDAAHDIGDGEIVKVYIRSNITHTYVISKLDDSEKIEIPLWKITDPVSKSKAKKQAEKFKDFKGTFASVKLDGLPIRQEAINTSKQVYRLREKEVIKILYRGSGAAVTNGKGNLDGEWLRVITSSGTIGWCFSAKLELYQGDYSGKKGTSEVAVKNEDAADNVLETIKTKKWYPDYYASFIRYNKIDLNRIKESYGFDFGWDDLTATAKTDEFNYSFRYISLEKSGSREYLLKDSEQKAKVILEGSNGLTLSWTEKGKPRTLKFVSLDIDLQQIVEKEQARRQEELKKIAAAGPVFRSSNYGTINFANETFATWRDYKLLVPNIIDRGANNQVSLQVKYFLSNQLKSTYDGILTMNFGGMEKEVNFFYKLTDEGLRLEDSNGAAIKDNTVTTRGTSPLIMFFSNK